jgi:Ni2+-binding GTPase involved in maturation of urease and hydrogenase
MNPGIQIFPLSAKTGEGVPQFTQWLEQKIAGD